MKIFHSVVKRLLIPPAVAALAVLILAAGTLLDILAARKPAGERAVPEQAAPAPAPKRVSMAANIPALTETEALGIIETSPTKAALLRLWPAPAHRERLFRLLLAKETEPELRLHLLGAFATENQRLAVKAARALAAEPGLPLGELLLSAFELLARLGEEEDLFLLGERESEPYQFQTLRSRYRILLHDRVH